LVYVAALTAHDLDRAAPLQALLGALEADRSLQDPKRELLLLRTHIALALVRFEDATEGGC
jgi:hypothetical protein